jgi:uncharacterized iron-regulated membrane protein
MVRFISAMATSLFKLPQGVREHAMGAIANGLAGYGGIVPFVATFLVRIVLFYCILLSRQTWAELRVVCCWCGSLVCLE